MTTYTLEYGMGYAGRLGNKPWIARITGSDAQYGLRREFLEADRVEKEHIGRQRTVVRLSYSLSEGLYEVSERGERRYMMVFPAQSGATRCSGLSAERMQAWVAALDEGETQAEARQASKGL